ncbi:hypothetical protein ACP4OV_014792 [Aristida adscensionis]
MAASRALAAGDPPESTRLRIGDDVAWWSDVSGVYDRDDSLKENTNPKCLLKAHHPAAAAAGASQRFSGNLKPTAAPIIGLPGRLGGARRHHHQHHHHPPAMFPGKARAGGGGGGGRAAKAAVPEPGSPKVSCVGKVLSDRERARRLRPPRPTATATATARPPSPGCCGGLGSFLAMRRSRSSRSAVECVDESPPPPLPPQQQLLTASTSARRREPAEEEAPGLGGMRRFASGRRAADWAVEMEADGRVARSGPL